MIISLQVYSEAVAFLTDLLWDLVLDRTKDKRIKPMMRHSGIKRGAE